MVQECHGRQQGKNLYFNRQQMNLRFIRKGLAVYAHEGISGIWARVPKFLRGAPDLLARDDFDQTRGVTTAAGVELWKLTIPSKDWVRGMAYTAVSPAAFSNAMARLAIQPDRFTFIDLGSGKGRALILAGEYGFKRIIGVEFAPALCEIAQHNLLLAKKRAEVVCQSATEFAFPKEPTVIFMYCPFSSDILERVLRNIHQDGFIVYINPRHQRVIPFPIVHQGAGLAIFRMG
jgi:SAM-dependent methyltransferase